MNFFSRVQLDISLVSYRVKHSKRNSLSMRAQVLFSIYDSFTLESPQTSGFSENVTQC